MKHQKILSLVLVILIVGFSAGIIENAQLYQSLQAQKPSKIGNVNLQIKKDGWVSWVIYVPGAFIYRNPNNPNDPMNEQCIANCVIKVRGAPTHNLFTNLGKNAAKTNFGTGSNQTTFLYIFPYNTSISAGATDTYCCGGADHSFPSGGGLNAQVGSYASTGVGTWTVTKSFTVTVSSGGTTTVYGIGLTLSATAGSGGANLGAEGNFANAASGLQTGDTFQGIYTNSVS